MFSYWKHVVAIEKMDLGSSGLEGEKIQFSFSRNKNNPRCKRFERLNSN
jgi:hypothetical protein